ncbi:radical SAM protein [bacterium]|nr:radical SAM protein [bacterium]
MLLINEIYPAICGESRFSGRPCTLVRLTGCHVRCAWCDSAHSFSGGESLTVGDVAAAVRDHGFRTVLVTGGEPLLQRDLVPLCEVLLDDGRTVLLETSGTLGPPNMLALAEVPAGVHRIVDLKAPASAIPADRIDWDGLKGLGAADDVKIVCADRADYEWGRDIVRAGERIPPAARVCFSPAHGALAARELAGWILADGLDADFQIQLHKAVWPDVARGV